MTRIWCLLGLLLTGAGARAAGDDLVYRVGAAGWILEQFGTDVTVLRSRPPLESGGSASLLLSCSGANRRLRLALPDPLVAQRSRVSTGSALIRPTGRRAGSAAVVSARFTMAGPDVITFADAPDGRGAPVSHVADMLTSQPRELEFLLSFGMTGVSLKGLKPLHLLVSYHGGDEAVLGHVRSACASRDE